MKKDLRNECLRESEDPLQFLARLEDTDAKLTSVGEGLEKSEVLDHFLKNLSDDYALQVEVRNEPSFGDLVRSPHKGSL